MQYYKSNVLVELQKTVHSHHRAHVRKLVGHKWSTYFNPPNMTDDSGEDVADEEAGGGSPTTNHDATEDNNKEE